MHEFVVKEESRGRFELAYGPGGAWSKLLAGQAGFRGTTVLRDGRNAQRYLTVELWDSEEIREQTLRELASGYSELEAALAEWVESRSELGVFRVLAEATVRPRSKPERDRAVRGARRSRSADSRAGTAGDRKPGRDT